MAGFRGKKTKYANDFTVVENFRSSEKKRAVNHQNPIKTHEIASILVMAMKLRFFDQKPKFKRK